MSLENGDIPLGTWIYLWMFYRRNGLQQPRKPDGAGMHIEKVLMQKAPPQSILNVCTVATAKKLLFRKTVML